jgi:hypothetical protein
MDNAEILKSIEQQKDSLFEELKVTKISKLHQDLYDEIKEGRVFVYDNAEKEMLHDLEILSKDTSRDIPFIAKASEYLKLDNEALTLHFEEELELMLDKIIASGHQEAIQALTIEYDHYYRYVSFVTCYGQQSDPAHKAGYVINENDYDGMLSFIEPGINFEPALVNCEEFEDFVYLSINVSLQHLFSLHASTLLHNALENFAGKGKLDLFTNRPFTFYIKQAELETRVLYQLT